MTLGSISPAAVGYLAHYLDIGPDCWVAWVMRSERPTPLPKPCDADQLVISNACVQFDRLADCVRLEIASAMREPFGHVMFCDGSQVSYGDNPDVGRIVASVVRWVAFGCINGGES